MKIFGWQVLPSRIGTHLGTARLEKQGTARLEKQGTARRAPTVLNGTMTIFNGMSNVVGARRAVPLLTGLFSALLGTSALAADLQQYGRAYLAEGNSAAAIQSYGELVRQNPFDPVALNNMAIAKAAAGDYQSALELLTRAARLAPQRTDIRENLSQLQSWQQQTHSISLNPLGLANKGPARNNALLPEPPPLWALPASAARAEPAVRR